MTEPTEPAEPANPVPFGAPPASRRARRTAAKRRPPRGVLPVLGLLCVIGIAVAVVPVSSAATRRDEISFADRGHPPPPPSTTTAATTPPAPGAVTTAPPLNQRIVVVGDSIPFTYSYGLIAYGEQHGFVVDGEARLGCGLLRGGRDLHADGDAHWNMPNGCDQWATWIPPILAEQQPGIVLVGWGAWDIATQTMPNGTVGSIGQPEYDDWVRREMHAAIDLFSKSGAKVVWVTRPETDRRIGTLAGMSRPRVEMDAPERTDRWNELIREVVATYPGSKATVLELGAYLESRPGGPFFDRPDGIHWTLASSGEFSNSWLGPQVEKLLGR